MDCNYKIFPDTMQNFTTDPYRRVELTAQIAGGADRGAAIARLTERMAAIPNVEKSPAPDVTILTFTPFGPMPVLRPYRHSDHYRQVYFDTNMVIREATGDGPFPGAGYPPTVHDMKAAAQGAA